MGQLFHSKNSLSHLRFLLFLAALAAAFLAGVFFGADLGVAFAAGLWPAAFLGELSEDFPAVLFFGGILSAAGALAAAIGLVSLSFDPDGFTPAGAAAAAAIAGSVT